MKKYVYSFNEGSKDMKGLLGEKGANLAEMTQIGLPVPFGFTVTTEVWKKYFKEGQKIEEEIIGEIREKMEELENVTGKKFGDVQNPLLVSVRSGAEVSMPDMLDTILNLGLNDNTVEGLAELTGNHRFAYDSYRRFIQAFGEVVLDIPRADFDAVFTAEMLAAGVDLNINLSADHLRNIVTEYKSLVRERTGKDFPQDPEEQLKEAVQAVFRSWNNERAVLYRKQNHISDDLGTAVSVQAMVFGNMGDNSGIGVAFTRNPSNGEKQICGKILINAQGEDFAAGLRDPQSIEVMEENFPEIYNTFRHIAAVLEKQFKDIQDMQFTVENNRLYVLQTKTAEKTLIASMRAAVDMANEGLISRETAIRRIDPYQISSFLHQIIGEELEPELLESFYTIMSWADDIRMLKIRVNADNPEETEQALKFGAEGIGLCRTEYMFCDEERISVLYKVIFAHSREERIAELSRLLPLQRADFIRIFQLMEDKPVTIRLLDPLLHEFLPRTDEGLNDLAEKLDTTYEKLKETVSGFREVNPSLGNRGCRIAISYPEIAEMQTRAIIEAAIEVAAEKGINIEPEIMVPLVGNAEELRSVRAVVKETAEMCKAEKNSEIDYLIGTMIEVPRAALTADKIAKEADFFSFGTNDLTQMVFGMSQVDSKALIESYIEKGIFAEDPFKTIDREGVGSLMEMAVKKGKHVRPNIKMGICGEQASDPKSIEFCHSIGLNYVSCSALQVPVARIAAAQAAILNKEEISK